MTKRAIAVLSCLVLTACAGLNENQRHIYTIFEECRDSAGLVQLTLVNPDGSFRMEGRDNEVEKVMQCVERRGTAHRR
jgi:hypothetical protein